ncbi:carbohydrate ABC transporter permease [Microlunatus endophyticus]
MLAIVMAWVYPFLWMVSAALKDPVEVFSAGLDLIPRSPQWHNFVRAWNDANFGRYLLNTVLVTVFTVVIVLVRCAMAGYVLARYRFYGRKIILGVLIGTLFVPTGYTIIPVVDIATRLHLLNSIAGMVVALSGVPTWLRSCCTWAISTRSPRSWKRRRPWTAPASSAPSSA